MFIRYVKEAVMIGRIRRKKNTWKLKKHLLKFHLDLCCRDVSIGYYFT
jgi:hypothetical protein